MSVTDGIGQTPCSLENYLVLSKMQHASVFSTAFSLI